MFASLPMYDRATTADANDRFWALIREEYGSGPERLSRDLDLHSNWESPDMLLSQTCGLPFRTVLHGKVIYVCTPDYGLRGCPPGYYRSMIAVRHDDPRRKLAEFDGATLARNDVLSQSGWGSIWNHLAETGADIRFGRIVDTGAHAVSAEAVAIGEADIAALDAATWILLKRESDIGRRLRAIGHTRPRPGLPYITAKTVDPEPLFAAMQRALARLSQRDRARLLIKRLVRIQEADYLREPNPPREN